MKEDLIKLYNTMILIETKGDNTKIMADCLRFVEQLVKQTQLEAVQVEDRSEPKE